ncbi:M20 family metallopeptidase [Liquorilactobacillus mali]|uniref:Probable succinyl-diaminopimelate desuccinylase n=1 Tax=Liquorilactobacillus mali KCTC 3596 = DSM 20444 TaxID=1046596 RepID=J0L1F9_9LACO|nr:M20 family metallopeptidase [Liquorilactobacillus mali]EJF01604.1 acetylornithine deacetylase/succinyl-diaminopimelate desuccinylase [Liquorilactobacillus mali KCTC 3596 = DSM 20444]KRN08753.1 acetylornithine deacetylase succinyl-diaminopimelate desuccinylase [Liquorilactobacillus mali KCTC 3596 = DSM 20444]QFQ74430.1 M20 family metallopeptidase [Liquorilactobacillus mali]
MDNKFWDSESIRILRTLVETRSYTSEKNELVISKKLFKVLKDIGCEVEVNNIASNRANVIARVKGNGRGGNIVLNTHMDVVPSGNGWGNFDPNKLTIQGNRAYGRGTVDAKGPLTSMIMAIEYIILNNIKLNNDITLIAVADEEGASLGARLLPKIKANFAVVGEATNKTIAVSHRGSLRPIISVKGLAAHSATPSLGVNAIICMSKLIENLDKFNKNVLSVRKHKFSGSPTLIPTIINGGIKESMVPDYCEVVIDRRLIPGEDKDTAVKEINEVINETLPLTDPKCEMSIDRFLETTGDPSEISTKNLVLVPAKKAIEDVYGSVEFSGLDCNCDMSHFMSEGITTFVYGPGNFKMAHQPNEYIELNELINGMNVYKNIILNADRQYINS